MKEQAYPYTAGFAVYTQAGIKVYFTIGADEPDLHLQAVENQMAELARRGYTANPPSVNDGEKVENISGWVLGETSNGQPCVYLYGTHPGLQFKMATVYEERLAELPFPIKAKSWPGAAPTREVAENKGYFNAVPEFQIVMVPHEYKTKDDGTPVIVFGRVHKAQQQAPSQPPAGSTNGAHEQADEKKLPWWKAYKNGDIFHTWDNRDKAIDWGFAQGVFSAHKHAENAYVKLQSELKPSTAGEMFEAWVKDVHQRKANIATEKQADADSDAAQELEFAAAANPASQYAQGA